jgi:hypothetical protein
MGATLGRAACLSLALLCLLIGLAQPTEATPTITRQPGNRSVLLGQNAQFIVTATGSGTLAYQWRCYRVPLTGATSVSLLVTNVALSNLGPYDVVVSDTSGAVTSAPAWLKLARWTNFVYFGASESLNTDGRTWVEYLADLLGIPLDIHSVGAAATSGGTLPQITDHLRVHSTGTNNLIGFWTGGEGRQFTWVTVETAASNRVFGLRRLIEAGGRDFLLPTFWPAGEMPPVARDMLPQATTPMGIEWNALVDEALLELEAQWPLTVFRPDMHAFFLALAENPARYGFTEVTNAYGAFWLDAAHFRDSAHRLISREMYAWLIPPLRIDGIAPAPNGDVTITWSGGSPPYQLQRATNLLAGQWEQVGEPAFVPSATLTPQGPQEFFRVLSVGQ